MIENTTKPPKQYACNGATTNYPIPFDYVKESDLIVSHVLTDSTVVVLTQNASGDGGYTISNKTVITNATFADGTLVIDCETEITQKTDWENNRKEPAEATETAMDKLTVIARDLASQISRAIVAKATDDLTIDYHLPSYSASDYLQWHPTEKKLRNAELSTTGTETVGVDVGDIVRLINDGSGNGVFPYAQLNLINESDMVSNSATRAPTQQSVKSFGFNSMLV